MGKKSIGHTGKPTLKTAAESRLASLPPRDRGLLKPVAQAFERNALSPAWAAWLILSARAPEHPETLRWSATLFLAEGQAQRAIDALDRALTSSPADPDLWRMLAAARTSLSDHAAARMALLNATHCTRHPDDWLALGIAFDQQGHHTEALDAADRSLALAPEAASARLLRARCLQALGHISAAATEYRYLISRHQEIARSWFGLLDLKTERIDATELAALQHAEKHATQSEDQTLLGFALGRAQEVAHVYEDAYRTLERVNRRFASTRGWNPAAFSATADAIEQAFRLPTTRSDVEQGQELIFLVGLPRSGSTLFEQILAAHPQVEAASELPYLEHVIARESQRRQKPLAQWATQAEPADWARLGQEYLQLTARWRENRPTSTDKMPSNWLLAGAITAMLPAARIIDCRRDAVETCWSCFKQFFAPGKADYSYDLMHLTAYWKTYLKLSSTWSELAPEHYRVFQYESLIADLEQQVRSLLSFCGLTFDSRCLHPHEAERGVRTASAAQVRQPLRKDTAAAIRYGELMTPLRLLLSTQETTSQ